RVGPGRGGLRRARHGRAVFGAGRARRNTCWAPALTLSRTRSSATLTAMADTSRLEKLLIAAVLAVAVLHLLIHRLGIVETGLIVSSLIVAITCFAHAYYSLGWQRAAALFALTVGFSWVMETISVETCMVGCYEYTAVLGPRLGVVPLVIPLGWFTTTYTAYVIVNLIVDGTTWSASSRAGRAILIALVGAFIQSAWDLAGDPYMIHVIEAWVWIDGGPFFGVPWGNYIGWI